MNKKKIGLVVAIEISAFFKLFPSYQELEAPKGFKVYFVNKDNYEIYVIKTGMGEVASSSGTQYLITKYNVSLIINFGVVGGITNEMAKEKICLVNKVIHYRYDCSEFMPLKVGQVEGHDSIYLEVDKKLINEVKKILKDIKLVTCCSGDKFIATAKEKESIHKAFNADIVDMESSGIVLVAEANDIPCLLFKAVSDGLNDGAEGFYKELENASIKCLETAIKVIDSLR